MQCEVCGESEFSQAFETHDLLMGVGGMFMMSRCLKCGTYGQDPTPAEEALPGFYPPSYGPYQRGGFVSRIERSNGLRHRVNHVMSVRREPGSLLDVGCSSGYFLDRMRKKGWSVSGVELNSDVAERARLELNIEVVTGTLESAQMPSQNYDVVTLWDVLEHVVSPRKTLREIARVLRPNGWLVFRVPNPESLSARLFGYNWFGWELPRHLWIAPRKALENALVDAGFRLAAVRSSSGRFAVLRGSLRNAVNERIHTRWLMRALTGLGGSVVARATTAPYFAISGALGHGSLLTYLVQLV